MEVSALFITLALLCLTGEISSARSKRRVTIKTVWEGGQLLEGPHWSTTENALYWVDITGQNVHRLDPATKKVTTRHIGYGPVTPVVPVANAPGKLVVGVRAELYILSFDMPQSKGDAALRLLSSVDFGLPENRMNDGKADAKGRLWVGTMGQKANLDINVDDGSLYMVTKDNYAHPAIKVRPISISNGIAWSNDNKLMYYIDSQIKKVEVFDFDLERGHLSNRRTIFDFLDNDIVGLPDGMTIDTDGNLWIACYDAGKVIKVNPSNGKLLRQYTLPATKVTSVAWGGANLDILYVTTARVGLTDEQFAEQPKAGSMFTIEGTGSRGLPANDFVFE